MQTTTNLGVMCVHMHYPTSSLGMQSSQDDPCEVAGECGFQTYMCGRTCRIPRVKKHKKHHKHTLGLSCYPDVLPVIASQQLLTAPRDEMSLYIMCCVQWHMFYAVYSMLMPWHATSTFLFSFYCRTFIHPSIFNSSFLLNSVSRGLLESFPALIGGKAG